MAKISDMLASGVGGVLPMLMAKNYNKQKSADSATAADEARQAAMAASAQGQPMKKGGKTKGYAKGGVTRADGCITKGHTKGRMI
jgi:hypothetical protein